MELVVITAAIKFSMPSSVLDLKHVHTQAFFLQLVILAPYSSLLANKRLERFTPIGGRALFCIKDRGEYTSIESEHKTFL